jgi:hypothetical protein
MVVVVTKLLMIVRQSYYYYSDGGSSTLSVMPLSRTTLGPMSLRDPNYSITSIRTII